MRGRADERAINVSEGPPIAREPGPARRTIGLRRLCRSRRGVEEYLVEVVVTAGAYLAEPGTFEGPLRSDVVPGGVRDNSGQSVIGRDVQQGDQCLRCIAVTTRRWGKAVTDLDTPVVRLTLETDSTPMAFPSAVRVIR